jgi:hypothetical protein
MLLGRRYLHGAMSYLVQMFIQRQLDRLLETIPLFLELNALFPVVEVSGDQDLARAGVRPADDKLMRQRPRDVAATTKRTI